MTYTVVYFLKYNDDECEVNTYFKCMNNDKMLFQKIYNCLITRVCTCEYPKMWHVSYMLYINTYVFDAPFVKITIFASDNIHHAGQLVIRQGYVVCTQDGENLVAMTQAEDVALATSDEQVEPVTVNMASVASSAPQPLATEKSPLVATEVCSSFTLPELF